MKLKSLMVEASMGPPMDPRDVNAFMKKNSWFEYSDTVSNAIDFMTSKHGNEGTRKPGEKDIKEAKRMIKLIDKKLGLYSEIGFDLERVYVTIEHKKG